MLVELQAIVKEVQHQIRVARLCGKTPCRVCLSSEDYLAVLEALSPEDCLEGLPVQITPGLKRPLVIASISLDRPSDQWPAV